MAWIGIRPSLRACVIFHNMPDFMMKDYYSPAKPVSWRVTPY